MWRSPVNPQCPFPLSGSDALLNETRAHGVLATLELIRLRLMALAACVLRGHFHLGISGRNLPEAAPEKLIIFLLNVRSLAELSNWRDAGRFRNEHPTWT